MRCDVRFNGAMFYLFSYLFTKTCTDNLVNYLRLSSRNM